jgi:hypothetical protein
MAWSRIGSNDSDLAPIPAAFWLDGASSVLIEKAKIGGQAIFDLRIFPILRSPDAAAHLDGLSLGEAFRKHVVGDCELAEVRRALAELRPSRAKIFEEGQTPEPVVNFHWRLEVTAETIAYQFTDSHSSLMEYSREPTSLENAASEVIADRFAALIGRLAGGDVVALGTFFVTGTEGPIPAAQWTRKNLSIDVQNDDVCEIQDYRHLPIWTGVRLQSSRNIRMRTTPDLIAKQAPAQQTKALANSAKREKFHQGCYNWLFELVGDPGVAPRTTKSLLAEARVKFPGISERAVIFCRQAALKDLKDPEKRRRWEAPGPRPKSPQI